MAEGHRPLLRGAMMGGAAYYGGPIQLLVIAVEDASIQGQIFDELARISSDCVSLIDLLLVHKTDDGRLEEIEVVRQNDQFGSMVGSLIGVRDELAPSEDATWYVDDEIPAGASAVVALIEHKWAAGLEGTIARGHGFLLSDAWLHPDDVSAVSV